MTNDIIIISKYIVYHVEKLLNNKNNEISHEIVLNGHKNRNIDGIPPASEAQTIILNQNQNQNKDLSFGKDENKDG